MSVPWVFILLVPGAYLLGAVPWGAIIARLVGGVDVRRQGSGSSGMTNVMRTVGVRAAVLVLALDLAKGAGAVLAARLLGQAAGLGAADLPYLEAACALAALVGHTWSILLRFRGGKGIATGLGALAVLSPWTAVAVLVAGLPLMAATRYVSLGSVVGTSVGGLGLVLQAALGADPPAYGLYGGIGAAVILFRHRENLRRLLAGTEARLGQRVTRPAGETTRARPGG